MDLTAQPVAMALAEFTKDHWVPASEAGVPHGLFDPKGVISPRLGLAWRPTGESDLVVRAGYGIFPFGIGNGNRAASSIIGPPYWNFESATFSRASNQSWETAFPDDPKAFLAPIVVGPCMGHRDPDHARMERVGSDSPAGQFRSDRFVRR